MIFISMKIAMSKIFYTIDRLCITYYTILIITSDKCSPITQFFTANLYLMIKKMRMYSICTVPSSAVEFLIFSLIDLPCKTNLKLQVFLHFV